jgi:hypothetical protein
MLSKGKTTQMGLCKLQREIADGWCEFNSDGGTAEVKFRLYILQCQMREKFGSKQYDKYA